MFIEKVTSADVCKIFDDKLSRTLHVSREKDCITVLQAYEGIVYSYKFYDFKGTYKSKDWTKFLALKFGDKYLEAYHKYLLEKAEADFTEIKTLVRSCA